LLGSASPVDSTAAVQLDEYAPNKLSYGCTSSGGGIVVFSETYYPEGWVCRIDGQELPTARVNYILRAVRVPEGDHTIEWSFEPAVWEQGSQISMAGSCLLYL
ncbi:MAG: YfhO family protein, partial [Bacteroidota bacterium]